MNVPLVRRASKKNKGDHEGKKVGLVGELVHLARLRMRYWLANRTDSRLVERMLNNEIINYQLTSDYQQHACDRQNVRQKVGELRSFRGVVRCVASDGALHCASEHFAYARYISTEYISYL